MTDVKWAGAKTVRETDSHIYFWGSFLSNWYRCPIDFSLTPDGVPMKFHCTEQIYMALKALTFNDFGTLSQIMDCKDAKESKVLGRQVIGFSEEHWNRVSYNAMFRACRAKFSQNLDLFERLLLTQNKVLVEGSPFDKIWGVGIAWDDPLIEDQNNWNGENRLGNVLMAVRSTINNYPEKPWTS